VISKSFLMRVWIASWLKSKIKTILLKYYRHSISNDITAFSKYDFNNNITNDDWVNYDLRYFPTLFVNANAIFLYARQYSLNTHFQYLKMCSHDINVCTFFTFCKLMTKPPVCISLLFRGDIHKGPHCIPTQPKNKKKL